MVAVVGTPAEGYLRKVAGTDHETVRVVGYVHQDLGPFTSLGILERNIMVFRIMSDI